MKIKQQVQILMLLLLASSSVYSQDNHNHEDGSKRLSSFYSEAWDKTKGIYYAADSVSYKYTSNGKLLEAIYYGYNTTTTIYNPREIEYNKYDSKGNRTLHVDSFLFAAAYYARVRETFLNNNLGQVLINTQQNWDNVNSVWSYNYKYIYSYTPSGNIQNAITQYYNSTTKVFDNNAKDSNIYNAQNMLAKKFTSSWDKANSKWILNKRRTYFYSGTNKESGQLFEVYISGSWINTEKTEITFYPDDMEKASIFYSYNTTLFSWEYGFRDSYSYDKVASTRTSVTENWNSTNKAWDTIRKNVYQLNSSGWETGYTEYKWDATYHAYKNYARVSFTYNSNGYITYAFYEIFDDFSKVWKNNGRYYYRYDAKSGISKVKDRPSLVVYPNPTIGNTIQVISPLKSPYQLYDINGKMVLKGNLQVGKNGIDIEQISKGIYYLRTTTSTNKILRN